MYVFKQVTAGRGIGTVPCEILRERIQMEPRKGFENTIVPNGKIVNIVSKNYGHIPTNFSSKRQGKCLLIRIMPNYI